jgi:hypothetical protein
MGAAGQDFKPARPPLGMAVAGNAHALRRPAAAGHEARRDDAGGSTASRGARDVAPPRRVRGPAAPG